MPAELQHRAADPPIVVLDTNVVLDLLLFRDLHCRALMSALTNDAVRWVATTAMRKELAQVIRRGDLAAWDPDPGQLWRHWDHHCVEVPPPEAINVDSSLLCTDPDDQKFIDLALACRARWLFSRDGAVLRLARRLRVRGVEVIAPSGWALFSPGG